MTELEERILISNNTIIKRELEDLSILHRSIVNSGNSAILILGLISYVNLINLEIINYIKNNFNINLRDSLKYKKIIKNIRARLKEDSRDFKEESIGISNLNRKTYEEFKNKSNVNSLFNFLIDNIGIYYIDDKIIGNTFLYSKSYKKFLSNGNYDNAKIIEYSKEQGQLIKIFSEVFKVSEEKVIEIKKIDILSKDFNVYNPKTKIFNNNIDRTICLKILDMISSINYYLMVVANILENNSTLRYRIAYMIWYTSYNDLNKIIEANSSFNKNLEEKEFIDILESQKNFLNRDFRNCMFHYDVKRNINEKYYSKDKMLLGLVEQNFNVNELEYILLLEIYLKRMINLFEKTILK